MMRKILFAGAFIFLLLAGVTLAAEYSPTQQFSKILMAPLYRESMTANTNYTYTVNVNPPDKISSVVSAILDFNGQINGQSQNFTLWVNGQSCNNPSYAIATAFSTTGNAQFYFDCSNVITRSGTYNVTIRSAVATGVISGWLDLTYMNNPAGKMEISGTEYTPNDPATIFVQLKDSYGNPVQNGSCMLDIWYPANSSNVHPYTVQDAPMLTALGDDGIYYYDLVAPSQLGVYMLGAKCSYSYNWRWFYPTDETLFIPNFTAVAGTFSGSTFALNDPHDASWQTAVNAGGGANIVGNYSWNVSVYGALINVTNVNVYFYGQAEKAGTLTIAYWNGTAFVNAPNALTFVGTASVNPISGNDQLFTTNIPTTAIIGDLVRLQLTYTGGATYHIANNWIALAMLSSAGTVQELKGSGEMHITNIPNATVVLVNNQTPAYVWNFTIRNVTNTTDVTNYSLIGVTVWNQTSRNLTYYNMTDTTNYTLIQQNQYNYTARFDSIDAALTSISNSFSSIAANVWSYVGRYVHGVLI